MIKSHTGEIDTAGSRELCVDPLWGLHAAQSPCPRVARDAIEELQGTVKGGGMLVDLLIYSLVLSKFERGVASRHSSWFCITPWN